MSTGGGGGAAAPTSPFFDFESQVKSPDAGYSASDEEAFAFKPLARGFHKLEFFESAARFFIFGSGRDRGGARTFSLLEIYREEGRIEENSIVSIPSLADDVRYNGCKGTVVGAANGSKWPVQLSLRSGGTDIIHVDASSLVHDGAVKWSAQELEDEDTYLGYQKELAVKFREGWVQHDRFDGIIGFARFTEGWYLLGACKKEVAARVCSCDIYRNGSTIMIPFNASKEPSENEKRYRSLFKTIVEKQDTRGFYFSHDYDVSRTLQSNMGGRPRPIVAEGIQPSVMDTFDEKFVWNLYLLRDVPVALHTWCVVLIQGFVEQHRVVVGFNRIVSIALLARRSRHFAGTRYNKRGQDMQGHCANEVEVEQIVVDESQGTSLGGHCHTSFVQLRASIPLFWSQPSAGLNPKPDVCLYNTDPLYHTTALHFTQLMQRYGSPVFILNLVKRQEKKKRESLLSEEFEKAVHILNAGITDKEHAIRYIHFDFFQESKADHEKDTVYDRLLKLTTQIVDNVGIFHAGSNRWASSVAHDVPVAKCMQQRGILRSNCIDCLDRTNAAQFWAGVRALTLQFQALGLTNTDVPSSCSIIEDLLMDLYVKLGDELAIQYVGSLAHDKTGGKGHKSSGGGSMRKFTKLIVSAQRYISNTFTDQEKQQAFDVFLGTFCPRLNHHTTPVIWHADDRSFSWSSSINREYCALRPNRPSDGWWRQPLLCFNNGVQLGYSAVLAAAAPSSLSSAVSIVAEPFKVSIPGRKKLRSTVSRSSSVSVQALFEERPMGFSALVEVQPEPYNDAQDDDYSLEGWGFDSSPSDQSDQPIVDRPLSIADAGSVAVQPVVTVPRVLPAAVSADTVVASAVKPRSDSIVTYKDTPNFRQLRESINYELSHNWRKLSYADGPLSDTDESLNLPRMRIEAPAAAWDGKRKNSKMSRLFTQSQRSFANFSADSASRNSLSLARVNVLEHFNDMEISDWAGGNDPFILNQATEEDLLHAEHGVGPVNIVILQHSRLPDHAFSGIQLINPLAREIPLELGSTPNPNEDDICNRSHWTPHSFHKMLDVKQMTQQMEQLTTPSTDWEMSSHSTKADVGIKIYHTFAQVDIDEEHGAPRVVVMSANFQFESTSDSLQPGDEIKSIDGLRMDLLLQSCQSTATQSLEGEKEKGKRIIAEVQNILLGCAGSPVSVQDMYARCCG